MTNTTRTLLSCVLVLGQGLLAACGVAEPSAGLDEQEVAATAAPETDSIEEPSAATGDALARKSQELSARACTPRTPTPLSSLDRGAISVAVDNTNVFWIAPYSALSGVYRAPKGGGAHTQLADIRSLQADGDGGDLALDGDSLFLAEPGDLGISPQVGSVSRVDAPERVIELARGESLPCRSGGHPRRVTLDGSQVYWTEDPGRIFFLGSDDPSCSIERGRVVRTVPKRGGVARTLGRVDSINVVVDSQFIYFTRGEMLYRMNKSTLAVAPVASGLAVDQPVLHMNGSSIYLGGRGGRVYAVQHRSGAVRVVWDGTGGADSRINALASDATYIYWTAATGSSSTNGIYRAPRNGGPAELRVVGPTGSLAVDAQYLYWGDRTVFRRCK
jgi:hypothetical protein